MNQEDRAGLEVIEMLAKVVELAGGLDGLLTSTEPGAAIGLRILVAWNRDVIVANMARCTHIARPRLHAVEGGRATDTPAPRSTAHLSLAPVIA